MRIINIKLLLIISLFFINISVYAEQLCTNQSYSDCYNKMSDKFKNHLWLWDINRTDVEVSRNMHWDGYSFKFKSNGVSLFYKEQPIRVFPILHVYTLHSNTNSDNLTSDIISFVIKIDSYYYKITSTYNHELGFLDFFISSKVCVSYASNFDKSSSDSFLQLGNSCLTKTVLFHLS